MLDCNWRFWNATAASDQVGWPQPTDAEPYWAYQRIAQLSAEYAAAGFSVIRLPPCCECAAGIFSGGYDLWNNYSIENTAFGTGEMLRQCVSSIHAAGMQAYGDLVLHQYDGGPANVYRYPGSNPKIKNGRFAKTPSCFIGPPPGVAADPVPDSYGNFGFGAMAAYLYSTPPGYMHDGAIAAAQWMTATIGYDGYRIDDVKGTYAPVIYDLLHADGISNLYAFGEDFTGMNSELWNWVHGYMRGRASCLDFGFHFNVGNICNNNSNSWMGALAQIGYCTYDSAHAVTFVESADTDNSLGQQIIWNKILGYAIMLTFPGYPVVYYRDWSTDPGCYGLKPLINNLVWIHEHFANGDFVPRLADSPQVFVHERLGYNGLPGCLCGFNNDRWHEYTVTVQTSWPANTRLHEYTGKYNTDIWTDAQGQATFTLPPNVNGMAFLIFAVWIPPVGFSFPALTTTQSFFGAVDLITPPALDGMALVGRVWIMAGLPIHASMTADVTNWSQLSTITYTIIGPDTLPYGIGSFTMNGDSPLRSVAAVTGWHTIQLNSIYMPLLGSAYAVKISYTGQANDLPLTPQIAMAADPAAQSAPTKPRLGLSLRTDYVQ
jgi:alpha-amylase